MNKLQHLLIKLAEECCEVSQIALKTAQFGAEEMLPGQEFTNFERCHNELNDLNGIIEMLNEQYNFNYSPNKHAINNKKDKVNKYLNYSIDLGLVK